MLFVPTAVRAFVEGIKKTDIADDSAPCTSKISLHCCGEVWTDTEQPRAHQEAESNPTRRRDGGGITVHRVDSVELALVGGIKRAVARAE